ncbi:LysE family transporter [Kitasatospora purpeofusca]|uniref:LysE family transporter n=1 Tax=Kitasatospora purpeofusca TaxID=67352 RepID=UPI000A7D0ED0|nr:LysE family transporter [Kitasatospora purpeofusca]MCX4758893.1 LysE family transporter [Kitasatospora purpeofusca]WSR30684.1 LysE family transporter [Kitasatospora purpeofusca]WSR38924.1 LysE family transporter [Kitasatospora purpeofusca]
MTDALLSGLLAGYGIAVPVGAISVLIVTLASRVSLARGLAAALGVATADGLYALLALIGGATLAPLLAPAAGALELAAAAVLVLLAAHGLRATLRTHRADRDPAGPPPPAPASPWRTYASLLGLTLLNPLTVVYFSALVLGGRTGPGSLGPGLVFVLAAFAASASWQALLATGGALLRRVLTGPRGRLLTGLTGNLVVLALAVRLALRH